MPRTNTTSLYRLQLVRESDYPYDVTQLSRSEDAARFFRPLFDGIHREQMAVALLDAKHRVIGVGVVSIGSLTASIVHPRSLQIRDPCKCCGDSHLPLCVATHNGSYVPAVVMWPSA